MTNSLWFTLSSSQVVFGSIVVIISCGRCEETLFLDEVSERRPWPSRTRPRLECTSDHPSLSPTPVCHTGGSLRQSGSQIHDQSFRGIGLACYKVIRRNYLSLQTFSFPSYRNRNEFLILSKGFQSVLQRNKWSWTFQI